MEIQGFLISISWCYCGVTSSTNCKILFQLTMSRSKKMVHLALLAEESIKNSNSSFTLQIEEPSNNPDGIDVSSLPIILIDEHGNSTELPNNNCALEEIYAQLENNNSVLEQEILMEHALENTKLFPAEENSCRFAEGNESTSEGIENSPELEQETPMEDREVTINIEEAEQLDGEDEPIKIKNRKRNTESWSTTEEKLKRQKGDAYLGRKKDVEGNWIYDVHRNKRQIKVRCNCKLSTNNKGLRCKSVSEDERKEIFTKFWTFSWKEKRIYVQMLCDLKKIQRARDRKETEKSRRSNSIEYHFKVGEARVRVCKKMFLNTLCAGEWTIRNWLKKNSKTGNAKDDGSMDDNIVPVPKKKRREREMRSLQEFFDQLPKMESHYCRASSKKLYLEPHWKSKSDLYEFYKTDWCQKGINYVSKSTFKQLFKKNNLSLFSPKKDACDICAGHKTENIDEITYNTHIQKKEEARNEKQKDKESLSTRAFTMDLQAVMLAPKSNVSAMYYKTKLAVHNMTFYDLQSKDGTCFLWNEIEGKLTADEFSTIIVCYLETVIHSLKESEKEIVLFSDGCNYQNRNSTLSNALLNFSVVNSIVVIQKYLERGHTQMEVDAMHSTIERKLKGININIPADYVNICKSARRLPKPYEVNYLSHNFFKNFSSLKYLTSIRPGKKVGDPTVTDIRALKYNPTGTIQYKLRFGDEWKDLPIRLNKVTAIPLTELPVLYKQRIPIKNEKFNHLQALKNTLEKDYHAFYDDIPHII